LPGVSLRPSPLAGFNPDTPPSTPFNSASDAFQLRPDVARIMERPSASARARRPGCSRTLEASTSDASRCDRSPSTLVPIRPRSRRERRSLRTFSPGVRFPPPRVPRWFQSRRTATPPFNSTPD
jgi:hypothetical protein